MALAVEITVLRLFLSLLILHVAATIYAQDDQSGFISLDCGSSTNYTQEGSGINYVSDDGFIDCGESHDLPDIYKYELQIYHTLRSFPENERNCYTLRPQKGKNNKYLIRATFFYGNYDSKGQPPVFDLYIGADYWATVYILDQAEYADYEIMHLVSSDYINVCLVNKGQGDPFISTLELRLLDNTMYKEIEQSRSLILVDRVHFGTNETIRYPDDKYDRIWFPTTCCTEIKASKPLVSLGSNNEEQVPSKVMSTAITGWNELYYRWTAKTNDEYIIYIHLAEVEMLQSNQTREFSLSINNTRVGTFSPSTNITTIRKHIFGVQTTYQLTATMTLNSTLPPILNAIEVYTLKQLLQGHTDDQDVAALWNIKSTYGLTKLNWNGDPCFPWKYVWAGLNCDYRATGIAKIVSLNLYSKGLSGEVAPALANLTMIQSLDLSYNNLIGNVPKFLAHLENLKFLNLMGNNFTRPLPPELLAKSKKGSLSLSIEESSCLKGSCRQNKQKRIIISSIVVITLFIVVLSSSAIVWKVKTRKIKALLIKDESFTRRKQKFTYSEVLSITNNFQNEIGRGGFGRVFHGSVGNKQVAIKMLSESSSQGHKEFQVEVKLLLNIHHKNITSLVGYCNESNHKGLIYDFMTNGNLEKHLFDGCPNVLSWETRLQIGCDVAEGLAYMHHGCTPPIVHRDIKPSNILLNEGFHAKLADFGLSRLFPTEDATHVSSLKVAGTFGYLDPEYYSTSRLTQKSDVYSFGVVLLELITGRRAITESINIVQWVESLVDERNFETIIDSRLEGRFDINSVRKFVDMAIACVSPASINRPTMEDVVMDLKHCLQAEKTRQNENMSVNLDCVSDPYPR